MELEFVEFRKIARLNRQCTVTEKIDGTNGLICIGENGEFLVGSRTRWIDEHTDNHNFWHWATENKEELLKLGKGYHYGEWWGSGIQRGYGLPKGEKRFSLFNTVRWCLFGETPKLISVDPKTKIEKHQEVLPKCCGLVPVLYKGLFNTEQMIWEIENLQKFGSNVVKGFMNPEGIVIYHKAAGIYFKATIEKDDEWKGKK